MDINIIAEQNIIGTEFGYAKFETWYKTTDLRYANKSIPVDAVSGRYELRLQQKWISDRGGEKWEWIPELPFKTFDFSSANLSDLQIEKVIEWMNTWEQLKDSAIPIRFKEDFTIKK